MNYIKLARKIHLDESSIIRRDLILNSIKKSGRGHLTTAFSIVEIIQVVYEIIGNDAKSHNILKDKFILSKGHGCLALYVELFLNGYFEKNHLDDFCTFGSMLGGHPECGETPGIEFSTGSLGHGLPYAVGAAMANKINLSNKKIFVLLGDGELNEGSNWESFLHASKHKLDNLIIIIDYNKFQAGGLISEVLPLEPIISKLASFGIEVQQVNGHNKLEMRKKLNRFKPNGYPKALLAHTIKGKGIDIIENNPSWHHKSKIETYEIDELVGKLHS